MKFICSLIVVSLLKTTLCAQKLNLTDTSYKSWSYIEPGYTSINDEGSFFCYRIANSPIGQSTMVLAATNNSWRHQFISSSDFIQWKFTADGRYFFLMKVDTLIQVDLKSKQIYNISDCNGYSLQEQAGRSWLVYHLHTPRNNLMIKNLQTKSVHSYSEVSGYDIDPNAPVVVLRKNADANQGALIWLDLSSMTEKEIYSGLLANHLIFDRSGKKMAFYTLKDGKTTIWSYNQSEQHAKQVADDDSEGIVENYIIGTDIWTFNCDGEELFINQKLKEGNKRNLKTNPVIWNFQDAYLASYSHLTTNENGKNFSSLNLKSGKIKRLLTGMQLPEIKQGECTDVLFVKSFFGDELPWNAKASYYLLFTKTGELQTIKDNTSSSIVKVKLSPDNNFLVYYDSNQGNYFSYHLKSKQTVRLEKLKGGSCSINEFRRNVEDETDPLGVSCWVKGTNCAIVQGRYDLWKVDLTGRRQPVNLTNSDTKKRTVFTIWNKYKSGFVRDNESIYITGFDLTDKSNGFYKLNLSTQTLNLICRSKSAISTLYGEGIVFKPSKRGVLIASQTSNSSINYGFNNELGQFVQLTDIHPERSYNWMTAELVKYKDIKGNACEGRLFKPENFDSTKKYPIIFHYYWDNSDQLNTFMLPDPSSIGFNIPLLVSKGYIVFWPNVYSEKRQPGESALRSVLAGADYLAQFSWADTSKMAISGHSWGGYVTNYVVSHTNRFKAAVSFSGVSNLIELYNDVWPGYGFSYQPLLKKGYFWMVDGLEMDVRNYVYNSPIVYAKDVSTPLLLMHNKKDGSVPVNHSIQLFVQLRSFNKPVWLLQYEEEKHMVSKLENKYDLQQRVISFFDHYLMARPIPDWLKSSMLPYGVKLEREVAY